MATTGTLMTANNIYGLVNPPTDPSANDPLAHQTINSGATNWGSHVDLSNAVVRLTTNQTIAGDKTFTGTVVAPTPVESDNTTKIATTAFVKTSIDNLVDSAPNNLNTLNELAAAINDDNNFHNTVTTALSGKHPSITSSARLNANLIGDNGNVSNAEYGYLNGVTSSIQTQINAKHPSITSSARLNANLIGANGNVSNTEFGYLDGVTSSIQTQINGKQNVIGTFTRLNANLIGDNGNVGNTEFGYLDGVTSSIQTQIDSKQATITDGDLTIARTSGLQSALDLKAPLDGPTFTGTPLAPTATAGTNTTQLATTAFVKTAVDNLVGGAPGALDTLNELAAALNDDSSFHTTITNQIATKQDTIGDGDLTIARTNGLQAALDSKQPNITTTSDISLNNIGISGDISSNGGFSFAGHIIPKTNSQYDLGSAEYKIRHLYLSNNSLWLGEEHKIEVSGGQMRFRKLQKSGLPTGISNNFPDASLADAIAILGKEPLSTINDFTLADWEHYSVLKGTPLRVDQIFLPDDINDDGGVLGTINGTDVSLNKLEVAKDLSANDISSNNLQVRPGYKLYADTINETTSASGVTVDSVLLKDGDISANGIQLSNLVVRSGGFLFANTINETTNGSGVTVDSVLLKDGGVYCNDICGNDISANDISSNNLQIRSGYKLNADTINETTTASGVTIESVLLKDQNVTAHTISAQNYAVGNVNFISASRQGNFRDLEVKDSNNNYTILLTGDGGNIAIDGTLSADTISEQTSGSGVTIDSVLLKDQNVTAHTVSASNYAVGGTNFISASRQGNFRDLEVKNSSNTETILLTGDGGDISINGTLSADTIGEKTSATGVTIDGVLLKDNDISANDISSNNLQVRAGYKLYVDTINESTDSSGVTIDGVLLKDNNVTCTDLTASGTTNVTTQSATDNSTKIATTAFVKTAIDNLIDGAPGTMDTLKELSTALDNNNSYATTITLQLAQKAPKADPTFTGTPLAPTANAGTNTTQLATTAFVQTAISGKQDTIGDGDLTIARTNGLQSALDGKQATLTAGTNITISGTTISASGGSGSSSAPFDSNGEMNDHIIPTTNSTYDIGSAEYKIRHLYLSNNSLWIGDDHKIDISGGKMRFKKRKNNIVPTAITNASGSEAAAIAHAGVASLTDMKLHHWEAYAHTLTGLESAFIGDIFSKDTANDWEEDIETITTFSGLSDVDLTGVISGHSLIWNGSSLVPSTTTAKMASIVPLANDTYSLGSPTNVWKDIYIGPGSLYIDGQKVIESASSTIIMGADANQNLKIKGSGSGQVQIEAESNNISIQTTGTGDVVLGSTGSGIVRFNKNIVLSSGVEISNISDAVVKVNDGLDVTGTVKIGNYTLPTTAGTSGQVLKYPSSGSTLEWGDSAASLSSSSANELSDISFNTSSVTNGQALLWNSTNSRWEPGTVASSGGLTDLSATSISDLSDVSLNGIQVNQTLKWDGSKLVPTTLATTSTKQGQVLETLSGIADGRTVVVESGSYILDNVTAYQDTTTSWADVTGSSISYTPPSGTKQVIFEFHLSLSSNTNYDRAIILFKMLIDGTSVTSQNQEWGDSTTTFGDNMFYRGIINITGTNDLTNGKLSSWSSSKTIKLQVVSYTNYTGRLHANYMGGLPSNGDATNTLIKPRLKITAIGESSGQAVTLTNNSVSDLSDVSFNTVTATNGQALLWNSTNGIWEPGTVSASSSAPFDSNGKMNGHILPTTNSTYDIGSAEYKIRHLYLSNNSLWIGDDHKIDISGGKMRFKKRKNNIVPAAITNASGTEAAAIAHAGVASLADMKLHHWEAYAHTLTGLESAFIGDIFSKDTAGDWEEDQDINSSQWITSSSDIYYNSGKVGLGTSSFVDTRNPNGIHIAKDSGISFQSNTTVTDSRHWRLRTDDTGNWGSLQFSVSSDNANGPGTSHAVMNLERTGYVGIGTTSPSVPLEIGIEKDLVTVGTLGYLASNGGTSATSFNNHVGANVSIKAVGSIWSARYCLVGSDRRIKTNIVDVSDNQALSMLRDIPCRYYEYKDKVSRGSVNTIGFIAQEVREHLPIAVDLQREMIPNEMRILTDISWNDTTLYTELSDCSGVKYRFYVSNDLSGNEVMKEVVGNADNSFTFEEKWNNVFCYGKEVDDFHTLDKQKLFALNFSATQELDKKVTELEAKVASQETLIQTLIARIEALENN